MTMEQKTLIFVPTYNEANNIEHTCTTILAQNLKTDILFLDDNSPDGTGKIYTQVIEDFEKGQNYKTATTLYRNTCQILTDWQKATQTN